MSGLLKRQNELLTCHPSTKDPCRLSQLYLTGHWSLVTGHLTQIILQRKKYLFYESQLVTGNWSLNINQGTFHFPLVTRLLRIRAGLSPVSYGSVQAVTLVTCHWSLVTRPFNAKTNVVGQALF